MFNFFFLKNKSIWMFIKKEGKRRKYVNGIKEVKELFKPLLWGRTGKFQHGMYSLSLSLSFLWSLVECGNRRGFLFLAFLLFLPTLSCSPSLRKILRILFTPFVLLHVPVGGRLRNCEERPRVILGNLCCLLNASSILYLTLLEYFCFCLVYLVH